MQKILKTQEDVLTNAIRKKVVQSPSPPPHASNSVWLEITNSTVLLSIEKFYDVIIYWNWSMAPILK